MERPRIGIVGSAGAYGRWLRRFFVERMGLDVLGSDPGDPHADTPDSLVERCDVLLFAAPIRHTVAIIEQYAALSAGREAGRLWLDVTSIKTAPVETMLRSRAEVVGLHPMTAPPKTPTLKGRVLVVCEARLDRWRGWLATLLATLEAECVRATAAQHDRMMALVQAQVHALHLAQAGVIAQAVGEAGLDAVLPFRSASFEMDAAILSRILSLNPAIYEDIQFGNPAAAELLDALLARLDLLRDLVARGDDAARAEFRTEFLDVPRTRLGDPALRAGNHRFEQLGYLLADLADARTLSVRLPQDRPGALRALLAAFERHGLNIASLHSSRTPAGEVHFRFGFDGATSAEDLAAVARAIEADGIGHALG